MSLPKIFLRPHTIPPWEIPIPDINLDLHKLPKNQTKHIEYRAALEDITKNFTNYRFIYTDGSKLEIGTGCSAVTPDNEL